MFSLTVSALSIGLIYTPAIASQQTAVVVEKFDQSLIRQTVQGPILGVLENNNKTLSFLGVPYAQAPIGDLRWKSPKALNARENLLATNKAPAVSLQVSKGKVTGSDDCLYLNIWRPNNNTKNLPVLVFLHGGNNQTGSSTAASYGEFLAASANAVVVGLNYRLGPLGFIQIPALKHGTPEENSGNFTLLDINAGLDWVSANIANFGGDVKNITLAGHSAGGRDVMAILTSPKFKGKFHKAMAFSGGQTISDPLWAQSIHTKAFAKLAVEDKKQPSETEAIKWLNTDSDEVRQWLYSIKSERLVSLMAGAKIRMRVFPHLFADGTVLPKEGMKVYDSPTTAKTVSDVPLLLLSDATEFKFYCVTDPYFKTWVADNSVLTDKAKKSQYSFAADYGSLFFGYANTQNSVERISQYTKSPIYVASFRWGTNSDIVGDEMAYLHGSKHGIHMDFLFNLKKFDLQKKYPQAYKNEGVNDLSHMLQSYVGNFLWTSNPNGQGLTQWQAWDTKNANGPTYLFMDSSLNKATAKMVNWKINPKQLLNEMENDKSIPTERKNYLIKNVLDGRFFSYDIDKHFGNPNHIMP